MSCREIDSLLDRRLPGAAWPEQAREHLRECPHCRGLVVGLTAFESGAEPQAAPAANVAARLISGLEKVRPLPVIPVETTLLALFAIAGGALLAAATGWKGWAAMSAWQRAIMFTAAAAAVAVGGVFVSLEMQPGRGRARIVRTLCWLLAGVLLAIATGLFGWAPDSLFAGHAALCFARGLVTAGIVLGALWIRLRRGYFVAPGRAGAAVGLLAGLGGFVSQELYCPVLETAHVAAAHVGLVAVSTLAGFLAGSMLGRRSAR